MKKKELIELINNECLDCLSDAEDIVPAEVECVAFDIKPDRHRWFSTSVNVYKCEDGFVGIRGVSQLYSEDMYCADCDYPCEASEYEEKTTVTYIPKKN